jgi:hypothetical protein
MSDNPTNQNPVTSAGANPSGAAGKATVAEVAKQTLAQRSAPSAPAGRNLGGRPRADGKPNKSGVLGRGVAVAVAPVGTPAATAPAVSTFDAEATKRACAAILGSVDRWLRRKVERRAIKITTAQDAAELAAAVGLEPEDAEMLASLTTSTLEKYSTLAKYAPEALLGMALAAYGLRVAGALTTLAEMEKAKAQAENLQAPPAERRGEL